jgi:DNA-damage-inducible protein D
MSDNQITNQQQTFEEIKHTENGVEFWLARELMPLLGYKRWEDFHKLIQKTKETDFEDQNDHIRYAPKLIKAGKGATRETIDYQLSRFACYKIAMLGNTNECVQARTYFAIQTRKQEKFEELTEDKKRLKIREDVTDHNKKLFETAKNSGVSNFANFNDAGYLGLYGMRSKEIVKKKGLGKDNLLDRAGATELAANLFRITQTDEKLNNENINSQTQSEKIHNMVGGKIRQTIKDIGGTLPENLEPQKHIKEVKKAVKQLTKSQAKPKKLE